MHLYIYCSTTYSRQGMEATGVSIDGWTDKEVLHIYNEY